jgi:glycosyltransferase involved in cell wall biosynthesis
VIPNGIEIERQPISAPASHDVIMLARHDQNKNVLFVVKAFARILELQGNWEGRLLIVGKHGRETQALMGLIKQLPKPEKVLLIKGLKSSQITQLLRRSLVLISASKMEGFDYPVLEANAEGLPTLLSDIPVHREFYGELSGFFSAEGNPFNLAGSILKLANDFEYWSKLSMAGHKISLQLSLKGQQGSIHQFLRSF